MQSSYKNIHSLDGHAVALELKYNHYPIKKTSDYQMTAITPTSNK
jgi:hypothetical protein